MTNKMILNYILNIPHKHSQ